MEKFPFLSMSYWFNKENSFKMATKLHALNGIVLNGLLILIILVFHSTMLPDLTHLLLVAMLFLIESIFLLKRVNNNDREEVFKMIKIGSGTLAAMNLLQGIASVSFTIFKHGESDLSTWNLILGSLNLILTALGVFGIWKRNTKLLSAYIIYSYIQSLIIVYFLLMVFEVFQLSLFIIFIPLLFIMFWKFFLIFFFVLHLNVITFTTNTETTENIGLQQV